jgi:phosphoglycerol transferase MdoB-like AlkP superfamily enzyme
MPRIFYDQEITKDELNTCKLSDEDLIQLMEKYKEKLQRYTVFNNEEKERTERKILMIHLEQVKRFHLNK